MFEKATEHTVESASDPCLMFRRVAAAVGDAIQWDGQYMPAGMDTGSGKVNEAFKDHVMARPLGARPAAARRVPGTSAASRDL